MRVMVKEVVGNEWPTSYQAGRQINALIAPVLARGEPVELDFADTRMTTAVKWPWQERE